MTSRQRAGSGAGWSARQWPEHAAKTFRLLPHAQLAVLPGTDHMQVMTRAEWLVPRIEAFLDGPALR